MHKPALLYASPFPPQQSGIAIYSQWLVEALSEYFDLTLYINEHETPDAPLAKFPILRHGRHRANVAAFEHRIYHVGNNPWYHSHIYEACLEYPGWVVLHEFVLYYLVVGVYRDRNDFYQQIFRIGGARAISALKGVVRGGMDPFLFPNPERVPLNGELLQSGNRIVVHSDFTYELVKQEAPRARVYRAQLVQGGITLPAGRGRAACLARWGIPPDAVVIASFGFVAPTKLNDVICSTVKRLVRRRGAPVYYLMVGEGDYVVSRIGERIKQTGYIPESEFDECLAHVDLVLNLRYPTLGETSAALLRAFAFGKPCIVTDVGWFSELPDNAVLKIDCTDPALIEEHLIEALEIFLDCTLPFQKMAQEAARYVWERHCAADAARQYFELLTGG